MVFLLATSLVSPSRAFAGPGSGGGGGLFKATLLEQKDHALNGLRKLHLQGDSKSKSIEALPDLSSRANLLYIEIAPRLVSAIDQMTIGVLPEALDDLPEKVGRAADDCFKEASIDRVECAIRTRTSDWALFDGRRLPTPLSDSLAFVKVVHLALHFALNAPRGVEFPVKYHHEDLDLIGRALWIAITSMDQNQDFTFADRCAVLRSGASAHYFQYLTRSSDARGSFNMAYPAIDRTGDCLTWADNCNDHCKSANYNVFTCEDRCGYHELCAKEKCGPLAGNERNQCEQNLCGWPVKDSGWPVLGDPVGSRTH